MKSSFVFLFCQLCTIGAIAQESVRLPDYPGKWTYTHAERSNEDYSDRFDSLNKDEKQAYDAVQKKLREYFEKKTQLLELKGVNVCAKSRVFYAPDRAAHIWWKRNIKPELFMQFCSIFKKAGAIEFGCDEVPYTEVVANCGETTYESGTNVDNLLNKNARAALEELFYRPAILMDLGDGVSVYDGYYHNIVVIAKNNKPYWIQVKVSDYVERTVAYYKASIKEGKVEHKMVLEELEKEIARIPPAMFNQYAYLSNNSEQMPLLGLCMPDEPGARELLVFNPKYFDPSLATTQIQLITIRIAGHSDGLYDNSGKKNIDYEFLTLLRGEELKKFLDVK